MSVHASTPIAAVSDGDDRILASALELFAEIGISRASTNDIARAAGINRATLYRRLGTKDDIVRAALYREVTLSLAELGAKLDLITDLSEWVQTAFASTVIAIRTNRIITKALLVDHPGETLPALTTAAGEMLDLATVFVGARILNLHPGHPNAYELAAMMVRVVQSLALTPDAEPRLITEQQIRDFALRQFVPLMLSHH